MIEQLREHITQKQLDLICDRIKEQNRRFMRITSTDDYINTFGSEYANHRRQNQLSQAIMSGFRNNTTIDGLHVSLTKDPSGYARPKLSNESIVIHIQSEDFNSKSKYLKPFYDLNMNGCSGSQLYCYIVFKEKNSRLISVTLFLPDEEGKVLKKEVLLDQQTIMTLAS